MKCFIIALLIALGCDNALAQTTLPANVFTSTPVFADTIPRPTFYFKVAPQYSVVNSLLLTWGTGSTKDGILVRTTSSTYTSYSFTDIHKTSNNVVTSDAINDIFMGRYNIFDGRLSFIRNWNTGDINQDVPLKKNEPNSFQWELRALSQSKVFTTYVGSCFCTFTQVGALIEKQISDDPVEVGFFPRKDR